MIFRVNELNNYNYLKFFVLILSLTLLTNCAALKLGGSRHPEDEIDTSKVRLSQLFDPSQIRKVPVIVSTKSFQQAIDAVSALPKIRMVRVYQTASMGAGKDIPEYRMFHVHKNGPFGLLGIKEGDVLLGVSDRLIPTPDILAFYPQALLHDKKGTLLYRAGGKIIQAEITLQ